MPPRKHARDGGPEHDDNDPSAKRRKGVEKAVEALEKEEAVEMLDKLVLKWNLDRAFMTYENQVQTAFRNFGVVPDGDIDMHDKGSFGLRDIDDVIHEQEMEAFALYHRLRQHQVIPDDPLRLRQMVKILELLFYGKKMVLSAFQAKLATHLFNKESFDGNADLVLAEDLDARLGSWALRFRYIDADINPIQKLLLHLLDCAMEKQYRKHNGWCYEPVFVNGHNTHAWKPVCEIREFVYRETNKEILFDQWCHLTQSGSNAKNVCEYLNNSNDFQFPKLIKNRSVFSFKNGVYLARTNKFYPFDGGDVLSSNVVAAKYFEIDFEPHDADTPWQDIPTPYFDSIMTYQDFSPAVMEWMFILIGRLLYDVGDLDGWQVIPFLRGAAGSGKSTITLKIAKYFYDPSDVGVLSNNVERKFGLSAFFDKFLFVAPEIKSDLQLEQAEFQSMVSGEDIQVAVKHQKAFSHPWKTPGILAGNEQPSWGDNSGSLQRRMILFDFPTTVVAGDMRLCDRLEEEMARIILKCNRAYLEKTRTHGGSNIWTILPDYFKGTRDAMAQDVNSVEAFLASSLVTKNAELFCPFSDFKIALKEFEKQNGYAHTKYTVDFFRTPFTKHGLCVVKDSRAYNGRKVLREYVVGIDITQVESAILM